VITAHKIALALCTVLLSNFLLMFLINFQKKLKIVKNNENPNKKIHFDIFILFLVFSTSSQNNLNFQMYFEVIFVFFLKIYQKYGLEIR
jgi:uncharacterized protein YsxB (DUF464 family)